MGFLSALILMLGAAFLYGKVQRASVEIAVGCVAVTLLSLVVAIVIAPWPIQMLILIGVLASYSFTKVNCLG